MVLKRQVVFVLGCGYGRSGTTWMQQYLSLHDGVNISGQPTILSVDELGNLHTLMLRNTAVAVQLNGKLGYAHHVARPQDQIACMIRSLAEQAWFCSDHPIVGAKLNDQSADNRLLNDLWPAAKYVVCMRDPRTTYEYLVATYHRYLDWEGFLEKWICHARAAQLHKRAMIFQVDRPGKPYEELASFVGAKPTEYSASFQGRKINARGALPIPCPKDMGIVSGLLKEFGYATH